MSKANPYNVPNADVAQVLEDAADLYESEKVEWCTGLWAKRQERTGVISACAEGAILLARGYDWFAIWDRSATLFDRDLLAQAANVALLKEINRGSTHLWTGVYTWNDQAIGGRHKVKAFDAFGHEVERVTAPIPHVAKAEVIEKMKQAAKNLRNS